MGVTLTIFDPVSHNTRSIAMELETAVVQQDETGEYDYYVRLTTSAKTVAGATIPDQYIRGLTDAAHGTTVPHNGVHWNSGGSPQAYYSLTDAIQDHVAVH